MTLEASITIDAAAARSWDAIVIGAGPAGAVAARQCALAGLSTLLVEQREFPRFKVCGGCLNQHALAVLDSLGLQDVLAECAPLPLSQFELRAAGRCVRLTLPGGVVISRDHFDTALTRAAIAAGAAFLPKTSALLERLPDDAAEPSSLEQRFVLLKHQQQFAIAAARIVIVADGLAHSSLQHHPELFGPVSSNSRIGVGGVTQEFPAEFAGETIFMAVGVAGYVGLTQMADPHNSTTMLNIAAALEPYSVQQAGGPSSCIAEILRQAGFPAVAALPSMRWHGTVSLTRSTARAVGPRLLVLGDAAGYVEPFTGEGIAWALSAAAAVAPVARHAATHWNHELEHQWLVTLDGLVRQRQRWCRTLATLLRYPLAVRCLIDALRWCPSMANPIIRRLNAPPLPLQVNLP